MEPTTISAPDTTIIFVSVVAVAIIGIGLLVGLLGRSPRSRDDREPWL